MAAVARQLKRGAASSNGMLLDIFMRDGQPDCHDGMIVAPVQTFEAKYAGIGRNCWKVPWKTFASSSCHP